MQRDDIGVARDLHWFRLCQNAGMGPRTGRFSAVPVVVRVAEIFDVALAKLGWHECYASEAVLCKASALLRCVVNCKKGKRC